MWQIIKTFIEAIIMLIGVFAFGRIVLNTPIQIKKKKLIVFIIVIAMIQTIVGVTCTGTFKTIIIIGSNILFYNYLFKISIRKSILFAFLQMLLLIIPDLLQLFFVTKVLRISKQFYYTEYAGSIIGNMMTSILFIIIVYLFRKLLRKLINNKIENNKKIVILLILTFICIGMFFYTLIKEFRFSDNIILYILSIVVLVTILGSLIKQTIENNKLTEKYDKLLDFMTTYEHEIEKERTLRHEIKNEFRTIKAKIQDKEKNKKIIEYIDDIVDDKYEVKKEEYAKFGYLPPNGIKGLCYFKMQEAEDKGIKVALSISKRVQTSNIYQLNTKQLREYGKILGVFLDNAIEASLNSEEKQIGIEAYSNKDKEFKMIITNTYHNEIDKNKIGKESFSTKGKNRGHGLLLVKHIIDNNNIFETYSDIQEKIYTQTIIVKKFEK